MPNPFLVLIDPVSLVSIAIYILLMIIEAVFPARRLPRIRYWHLKGIVSFFIYFYIATYLPFIWANYLPTRQLIDLSGTDTWLGAVIGVLLFEFGLYVWHRTMHSSNLLWRVFHQMHHSAERLDVSGAFYFSPFDMIGFTALSSLCFSVLTGLSAESITIVILATNFLSVFQHANIRTPVWLGYILQRPESHAVHHARSIHAYNYSDLPLFDILFGTFRNPKGYVQETGFYNGASSRIGDMLTFQDVSVPENK